jgi:hypothetical protein
MFMRYQHGFQIKIIILYCFKRNIFHASGVDNNCGVLLPFARVFRAQNITVAKTV